MHDVMALGATLLHSLWQATLLAAVLWLVAHYARTSAPFRYRLAYGTLLLQLVLSVITFLHYYTPAPRFEGTIKRVMIDFVAVPADTADPSFLSDPTFWMTTLVVCWLLSTLVGTSKLLVSFGRVRRMQRTFGRAISPALSATVTSLAHRIGYRGRLSVRIGETLSAPVLIGHLRPILLFPVAIVNQLTTEEAETVILHELAHLRRYDHWFNLLQCVIEVLYYYHPAVHWIGARIREEREYCCDDLVLAYGPGRLPYARALLHYGELAVTQPTTALSLTDGGGLLTRVSRFLHNQQTTYTMNRKLFFLPLIAVGVLVSTAAYVPFGENAEFSLPSTEGVAPAYPALTDTLPPKIKPALQYQRDTVIVYDPDEPGAAPDTIITVNDTIGLGMGSNNSTRQNLPGLLEGSLPSADVMMIMDTLRQRKVFYFPDSAQGDLSKELRKWSMAAESEATRLAALSFDFDSLRDLYARTTTRLNLDSIIDVASVRGLEHIDLDSLGISWGNRFNSADLRPLDLQGENIFRQNGETDIEYIERQKKVLLERLEALEARKRALEEYQKGKSDGFGLGLPKAQPGSLQRPFFRQGKANSYGSSGG